MKKHLFRILLSCLTMFSAVSFAQTDAYPPLQPLSKADKEILQQIPEFRLEPAALRRVLPAVVDNSATPYMRPLIAQVGLECGQASSIGVMFTYEINAKRRVSGSLAENQYATHFAYNFINGGSDAGINFFETMQIVKQAGNPNVADYGGMSNGGASRWMTGYQKYYNAMTNRVDGIYSIRTNTVEGLNTLKQWIYDHADGSEAGGMATFYSEFTSPPSVFPNGVPEAGKHVIHHWGSSPNHAMTIVGYHDSIRWDYNSDGQYTNNLDINGDGVIDVRDWEIGGFKMANTYGSISGWGDAGFSYMMYKTVADSYTQGGIWNQQVMIIDVKENYQPMLTAKVSLTHPSRGKIKLMTGVSTDRQGTEPEFVLQYPVFDFQGGDKPMQGNSGGPTIEVGLDMNRLLEYIQPGVEARFFFMVVEQDSDNSSAGTINSFSLVDYTSGTGVEIPSGSLLQPIINNSITSLGLNAVINYPAVNVATDEIPPFNLYEATEVQLEAEGGTSPYTWYLSDTYDTIQSSSSFPVLNGTQLSFSSNSDGTAEIQLPFEFPYFGKKYDKIYVAVDGFIMFEPSLVTWPYYIAGKSYVIQNKVIAPTLSKPFQLVPSSGDGIWYEFSQDAVIVRWKLSVSGQSGNSEVSMSAKLFADGKIEFYYGAHNAAYYIARFAGISNGDGENMLLLNKEGYFTPSVNQKITFMPQPRFEQVNLTKKGMLSAMIDNYTPGQAINVVVHDQNNIRSRASIPVEVQGVVMEYAINAGDDATIENGENVNFNIHLENKTPDALDASTLSLTGGDLFFTILNGLAEVPQLAVNETLNLDQLFDVAVAGNVPNGHTADFDLKYESAQGSWTRQLKLTAHAPELITLTLSVNDGENGILEPGETASLVVRLRNIGGAKLQQLEASLSTNNPDATILNGSATLYQLLPGDIWEAVFQIELDDDATAVQIVELLLGVTAANGFSYEKTLPLMTSLIVENFESGNFELFGWESSGTAPWTITTTTPYQGTYAARSGSIEDNQNSVLSLSYEVAFPDTISFYYKVSSENNYDYFSFAINGIQQQQWSGEVPWTHAVYQTQAGEQTFRWSYAKDYSVVGGSDCAWIDYILLPAVKIYTGIDANAKPTVTLNIGPNPFKDQFRIEAGSADNAPLSIVIIDSRGIQLFAETRDAYAGELLVFEPAPALSGYGLMYVVVQQGDQRLVKPLVRTR